VSRRGKKAAWPVVQPSTGDTGQEIRNPRHVGNSGEQVHRWEILLKFGTVTLNQTSNDNHLHARLPAFLPQRLSDRGLALAPGRLQEPAGRDDDQVCDRQLSNKAIPGPDQTTEHQLSVYLILGTTMKHDTS
jgi:hypothetical protein